MSIIHYLKALGAIVGKTKVMGVVRDGRYCLDKYVFLGFPDITFFYKNKLYFCEVKSPQGKQSEYQELFNLCCEKAGIKYILARKLSDITDIIK